MSELVFVLSPFCKLFDPLHFPIPLSKRQKKDCDGVVTRLRQKECRVALVND